MVSLVVDLQDGRSVEVASIGREGAVGGIISCGHIPAFTRAEVMVAGPAGRISMTVLEEAKSQSAHLRNLFCRYSDLSARPDHADRGLQQLPSDRGPGGQVAADRP